MHADPWLSRCFAASVTRAGNPRRAGGALMATSIRTARVGASPLDHVLLAFSPLPWFAACTPAACSNHGTCSSGGYCTCDRVRYHHPCLRGLDRLQACVRACFQGFTGWHCESCGVSLLATCAQSLHPKSFCRVLVIADTNFYGPNCQGALCRLRVASMRSCAESLWARAQSV